MKWDSWGSVEHLWTSAGEEGTGGSHVRGSLETRGPTNRGARCLLPFWCLLPAPCEKLGVSVPSSCPGAGPARRLPEHPEEGTWAIPPCLACTRGPGRSRALPKPLPAAGRGRKDGCCIVGIIYTVAGNPGFSVLCIGGMLWAAVYRRPYRNAPGFPCWEAVVAPGQSQSD